MKSRSWLASYQADVLRWLRLRV